MTAPKLHRNGTTKEVLMEQVNNAVDKLREAERALQMAGPHPRDFYVQGQGAYRAAFSEQASRLTAVQRVREEMEKLAVLICDQDEPVDKEPVDEVPATQ